MTRPIPLGPFELAAPLGKGGMAEVWRGIHVEQQIPVAIKVVTVAQARERRYIDAFRNEVQAVAALDHPGVILVLDYGAIHAEAESLSGGRLVAGSPYLVMELADRGALDRLGGRPLGWPAIRAVLLALLDSLAHAHARGVVHRDIKPANVLLCGPTAHRPGLKLTDFGIAHAHERTTRTGLTESLTGTPAYMAPEQIQARFRDFGPWTDLYAVGCLAFELVSGRPPFSGPTLLATTIAHLMDAPPRLGPQSEVPPELEAWILRLLQKDPADRFQRAADAALSLLSLDSASYEEPFPDPGHPASSDVDNLLPTLLGASSGAATGTLTRVWPTLSSAAETTSEAPPPAQMTLSDVAKNSRETTVTGAPVDMDVRPVSHALELAERALPPMPTTWRRNDQDQPPMQLVGAGLGLYGLRSIPLVDRDHERDTIWSALSEVRASRSARLLLLSGAAGGGKSRLVEWMCERAHELGAATVLKALHGRKTLATQGLSHMVARHLRCTGLDGDAVAARIEGLLRRSGVNDEYEWAALTELVKPSGDEAAPDARRLVRFGRPEERYVLIERLIERLGRERPVIVWLDDVQWGADSLAFAHHLLAAQKTAPCPALLLLTARDDAISAEPSALRLIDELVEHESAKALPVPLLAPADHSALVRRLLGLEGDLAAQVESRTCGNPLFAVQLIGDWVQRGVLRIGASGFQLAPGELAKLPDDIHQVWRGRIDRLLQGQPVEARAAVELAAVLGRQVDAVEWETACSEAGLPPDEAPLEVLLESRLLLREEEGWSFVHGMQRESFERCAREEGRWAALNAACARMLGRRYAHGTRGIAERLGRHLVEAGRASEALVPLLQGARENRASGDFRAATTLLDLRDQALATLSVDESNPLWADGWNMRANVHHDRGQLDEAEATARRAIAAARRHGWSHVLPWGTRELGNVAQVRGTLTKAAELYLEAKRLSEQARDRIGVAYCLMGLANVAQRSAEQDQAATLYGDALRIFEELGDGTGMAKCLCGMSLLARQTSELDRSDQLTQRARDLFERIGNQSGVADCYNGLAEASRFRGDLEAATEGYERALRLMEAIGSGTAVIVRVNLGLVLLARGRYSAAERPLQSARAALEAHGRLSLLACVHTELLPCAAAGRRWLEWDQHIERAIELLAEAPMVDPDIAWPTELGADLARAAGETGRAKRAYELALGQWRALRNEAAVERVTAALAG